MLETRLPLLAFALMAVALPSGAGAAQVLGPMLAGKAAAPTVAMDIAHRPATSQPTKATGPAQESAVYLEATGRAVGSAAEGKRLSMPIGQRGVPLADVVRVAHDRIYDTFGGRYYWTTGAGPGEIVLP